MGLVSSRSLQTQGAPRARQPWALLSNAFSVSKGRAGGLLQLVVSQLESHRALTIRTVAITKPELLHQHNSKSDNRALERKLLSNRTANQPSYFLVRLGIGKCLWKMESNFLA
jgi:hypothetical protein